jgi:hypothetical protein
MRHSLHVLPAPIDDPALQATRRELHNQLAACRAEQDRMEATWRKPTAEPKAKEEQR